MERGDDDDSMWSNAPTDILRLISSRLVGGEYFVFRAVCRNWRRLLPFYRSLQLHEYDHTPRLMTQEKGDIQYFHPLHDALITQTIDIPGNYRIRCSLKDWLLISQGKLGMFFFNVVSKSIIKLPDLLEHILNFCSGWTFSCPPDSSSSDCFVVGITATRYPPPVYMIKVGESRWTFHEFGLDTNTYFECHHPVFFENDNTIYVLGFKGNLGILSINGNSATEEPTWEFYGKPWPSRIVNSIQQVYTIKDANNRGLLVVLVKEEGEVEIWRYKMIGKVLKRERLTSLNNKTLFVSKQACYLKPCIAQGLGNKIYFPMLDANNNPVFYCLSTRRYYSFDYSHRRSFSSSSYYNLVKPQTCTWID